MWFEDSYKLVISLYFKIFVLEFNKISVGEVERNVVIYDFFFIMKYVKFFKFNVEWWIDVRIIFLLNDYNVDGFSKSGGVYFVVKFLYVWYKMV